MKFNILNKPLRDVESTIMVHIYFWPIVNFCFVSMVPLIGAETISSLLIYFPLRLAGFVSLWWCPEWKIPSSLATLDRQPSYAPCRSAVLNLSRVRTSWSVIHLINQSNGSGLNSNGWSFTNILFQICPLFIININVFLQQRQVLNFSLMYFLWTVLNQFIDRNRWITYSQCAFTHSYYVHSDMFHGLFWNLF